MCVTYFCWLCFREVSDFWLKLRRLQFLVAFLSWWFYEFIVHHIGVKALLYRLIGGKTIWNNFRKVISKMIMSKMVWFVILKLKITFLTIFLKERNMWKHNEWLSSTFSCKRLIRGKTNYIIYCISHYLILHLLWIPLCSNQFV